ncbi:MAG: fumarylacetoacetate hydrolase family protein [Rhodanobacteraceae bacterium]
MFVVDDYLVRLAGEVLPHDVSLPKVLSWDAAGSQFGVPDIRTVYAALLNDRKAVAAMDATFHAAPYHRPPVSPILYIKPRNTLVAHGARIAVPAGATSVQVGASIGIVLGRVAARVEPARALDYVAGFALVADLAVPHDSFFRLPACDVLFDGSCVIGPAVVANCHVPDPDAIAVEVSVGAHMVFSASTATSARSVARLLADVTEFMTLAPGDVLTMGVPWNAPVVHPGDAVTIEVQGWPPLRFQLAAASAGEALR